MNNKRKRILGATAGGVLAVFAKRKKTPNTKDLQKADYKTSTQQLGVRFTEKIRKVFRSKWIKIK